jgi:cell division protease FtsH
VPYTFFKAQVTRGNVQAIYSRGESVTGRFAAPVTFPPAGSKPPSSAGPPKTSKTFKTVIPSFVDPGLEALLIAHGVEISAEPIDEGGSPWATLLFGFGPALLFIGFYIWMFRRAQQAGGMGGGLMGIGKSRARRYDQQRDTKVTFDDVAGIDEARGELMEVVDFRRTRTAIAGSAERFPRGC